MAVCIGQLAAIMLQAVTTSIMEQSMMTMVVDTFPLADPLGDINQQVMLWATTAADGIDRQGGIEALVRKRNGE